MFLKLGNYANLDVVGIVDRLEKIKLLKSTFRISLSQLDEPFEEEAVLALHLQTVHLLDACGKVVLYKVGVVQPVVPLKGQ